MIDWKSEIIWGVERSVELWKYGGKRTGWVFMFSIRWLMCIMWIINWKVGHSHLNEGNFNLEVFSDFFWLFFLLTVFTQNWRVFWDLSLLYFLYGTVHCHISWTSTCSHFESKHLVLTKSYVPLFDSPAQYYNLFNLHRETWSFSTMLSIDRHFHLNPFSIQFVFSHFLFHIFKFPL